MSLLHLFKNLLPIRSGSELAGQIPRGQLATDNGFQGPEQSVEPYIPMRPSDFDIVEVAPAQGAGPVPRGLLRPSDYDIVEVAPAQGAGPVPRDLLRPSDFDIVEVAPA
jgi:hypothetical protein